MSKKEYFLLVTLALVQFTNIMDFMIMMPLGPQFMELFHIDPQEFSVLVSSYTITAGITGFIAAFFLDRFDRKKSLTLTYAGFILGTLACALAPDYLFLITARILTGMFGGVLSAQVLAIVGDSFPYERRAFAMGFVTTAFSLASVFGVPFGLYLAAEFSWHSPFYTIAGFGVIIFVLIGLFVPQMKEHVAAHVSQHRFIAVTGILKDSNQLLAVLFMITLILGQFTIIPFIAPYMVFNVGFTEHQLSYIYLLGGGATLLTSPLLGKVADRIGKQKVFIAAAALSIIPLYIITNLPPVSIALALTITTFFFMMIMGRMTPAMTMITGTVSPDRRGSFMAIITCTQMLSAGIASLITGSVVKQLPSKDLTHYNYAGYIAIACTLIAIWVARVLKVKEGERKIIDPQGEKVAAMK